MFAAFRSDNVDACPAAVTSLTTGYLTQAAVGPELRDPCGSVWAGGAGGSAPGWRANRLVSCHFPPATVNLQLTGGRARGIWAWDQLQQQPETGKSIRLQKERGAVSDMFSVCTPCWALGSRCRHAWVGTTGCLATFSNSSD